MAVVVLLPVAPERFDARDGVNALVRDRGGVAIPPPRRVPWAAFARLPVPVAARLGRALAARIALPSPPGAVAIFDPLQLPLAEGLLARYPRAALWYAPPERYGPDAAPWPALTTAARALHLRAEQRAAALIRAATSPAAAGHGAGRRRCGGSAGPRDP